MKTELSQSALQTRGMGFCFHMDEIHFESGAVRKSWRHKNHVISPIEFSSHTNPKCQVIVACLISPVYLFSNSSSVVSRMRPKRIITHSSGIVVFPPVLGTCSRFNTSLLATVRNNHSALGWWSFLLQSPLNRINWGGGGRKRGVEGGKRLINGIFDKTQLD